MLIINLIETTEEMLKNPRLNINDIPLNCIRIFKKILDNRKKLLSGISDCCYIFLKLREMNIKLILKI